MTIEQRAEEAVRYKQSMNCCQAVLCALLPAALKNLAACSAVLVGVSAMTHGLNPRSEERRVGKETPTQPSAVLSIKFPK